MKKHKKTAKIEIKRAPLRLELHELVELCAQPRPSTRISGPIVISRRLARAA